MKLSIPLVLMSLAIPAMSISYQVADAINIMADNIERSMTDVSLIQDQRYLGDGRVEAIRVRADFDIYLDMIRASLVILSAKNITCGPVVGSYARLATAMEKTTPGITEIASAEPMEFIRSDIYHSMTQLAPRFSVKETYNCENKPFNGLVQRACPDYEEEIEAATTKIAEAISDIQDAYLGPVSSKQFEVRD